MCKRWRVVSKSLFWSVVSGAAIVCSWFVAVEVRTSNWQARYFSNIGTHLTYHLAPGSSDAIRYPRAGPYDQRLGYTSIPHFEQRLQELGFATTAQARFSPQLLQVVDKGFFLPYVEKAQTGLTIFDRDDENIFSTVSPVRIYPAFDAIPTIILQTLLFIENRELLDTRYPQRNPAVEWDRLTWASMSLLARKLGVDLHVPGGSTLATQLEKYRHSPDGRTDSPQEKLRQMGSASLRAYLSGPDTTQARRAVALAYLNSMPLAAVPGYGEVHGLGDGLWLWFGADFTAVNHLLNTQNMHSGEDASPEQAQAYRQVLCLLLAQRRPAHYLNEGRQDLERLADRHLPLLAAEGIIPPAMRDAALQVRSELRTAPEALPTTAFMEQKAKTVLRTRLATALGVESLYALDRLDLTARATIDQKTQKAVADTLRQLKDPEIARTAGTIGFRLLNTGDDLSQIVYSLILYEHTPQGNLLRLHVDNYDEPLDVNEGIKLDLGSTAKLRVTVHYLELVASIYQQYVGQSAQALRQVDLHPRDVLSHWVVTQLQANPQIALSELLDAAMARNYSASPYTSFFTGGALHTFANFKAEDNHQVMSVQKALQNSVNLVFIRLMRDVVFHYLYKADGLSRWMDEVDSEKRTTYLQRFADVEGQVYLRRFYAKYRGKTPQEILTILTQGVRPLAKRLTTVYRSVYPAHDVAALATYLKANLTGQSLDAKELNELYDTYSLERFDLQDRGYIARMHPLELWLGNYLLQHPDATLKKVIKASVSERQQVYRWLFKTQRWYAQEKRIRILIEQEAFDQIHAAWKRLGYPFETLTPSYASAIGASGDRPAALAELVGILLNDGMRYPMRRFDTIRFASGSPYETLMQLPVAQGQRVLLPEVARATLKALVGVVEQGTARRIQGAYKAPDGTPLVIAGKTGTGDHRREISGQRGQLLAHQVISRTATFAFIIGDHHFGVLTAYISGPSAAHYKFTSALPVQVLKSLAPILEPMITRAYSTVPLAEQ